MIAPKQLTPELQRQIESALKSEKDIAKLVQAAQNEPDRVHLRLKCDLSTQIQNECVAFVAQTIANQQDEAERRSLEDQVKNVQQILDAAANLVPKRDEAVQTEAFANVSNIALSEDPVQQLQALQYRFAAIQYQYELAMTEKRDMENKVKREQQTAMAAVERGNVLTRNITAQKQKYEFKFEEQKAVIIDLKDKLFAREFEDNQEDAKYEEVITQLKHEIASKLNVIKRQQHEIDEMREQFTGEKNHEQSEAAAQQMEAISQLAAAKERGDELAEQNQLISKRLHQALTDAATWKRAADQLSLNSKSEVATLKIQLEQEKTKQVTLENKVSRLEKERFGEPVEQKPDIDKFERDQLVKEVKKYQEKCDASRVLVDDLTRERRELLDIKQKLENELSELRNTNETFTAAHLKEEKDIFVRVEANYKGRIDFLLKKIHLFEEEKYDLQQQLQQAIEELEMRHQIICELREVIENEQNRPPTEQAMRVEHLTGELQEVRRTNQMLVGQVRQLQKELVQTEIESQAQHLMNIKKEAVRRRRAASVMGGDK